MSSSEPKLILGAELGSEFDESLENSIRAVSENNERVNLRIRYDAIMARRLLRLTDPGDRSELEKRRRDHFDRLLTELQTVEVRAEMDHLVHLLIRSATDLLSWEQALELARSIEEEEEREGALFDLCRFYLTKVSNLNEVQSVADRIDSLEDQDLFEELYVDAQLTEARLRSDYFSSGNCWEELCESIELPWWRVKYALLSAEFLRSKNEPAAADLFLQYALSELQSLEEPSDDRDRTLNEFVVFPFAVEKAGLEKISELYSDPRPALLLLLRWKTIENPSSILSLAEKVVDRVDPDLRSQAERECLFADLCFALGEKERAHTSVCAVLSQLKRIDNEFARIRIYRELYRLHRREKEFGAAKKLLGLWLEVTRSIPPGELRDRIMREDVEVMIHAGQWKSALAWSEKIAAPALAIEGRGRALLADPESEPRAILSQLFGQADQLIEPLEQATLKTDLLSKFCD